jgi:hypothetical protein
MRYAHFCIAKSVTFEQVVKTDKWAVETRCELAPIFIALVSYKN